MHNLEFGFVSAFLDRRNVMTDSWTQNSGLFTVNNASFVPPNVPVLLQIMSGAQNAQDLLPSGSVIELPLNKDIEITLAANRKAVGGPHPFHLHGVCILFTSHDFALLKALSFS